MCKGNHCFLLVAVLSVLIGCKPASTSPDAAKLSSDESAGATTIARLHWLGKKKLAAEANATNFMAIWNLPESAKLETQILDKLATAPWRLWHTNAPFTNAPTALLRPLLDDVIQAESYLEVRGGTNQPGELVFAIRLNDGRAALWHSNLPVVLESLFPARTQETSPQTSSANFKLQTSSFRLEWTTTGDWMLLALSDSRLTTGDSKLLADVRARIQHVGVPFEAQITNCWLEVQAALPRLREAFALTWYLPDLIPEFDFTIAGDGENVRTLGTINLSRPVSTPLDAWRIPVNAIPKSLTSFTAARGLSAYLQSLPLFAQWQIGSPPDQLFIWSLPSLPMQSVFVFPLKPGDDRFVLIKEHLLTAGNLWLATNSVGQWVELESARGLQWQGTPFMTPFVRPLTDASGDFLAFGIVPTSLTNTADNLEIATRLLTQTNAVYYDWEFTGPRIESWFYMGQLARVILGRGQLASGAASTLWLKALQSKLSNAGTVITLVEPTKLAFERDSTMGFTAFELHLLADWIESPRFPLGLHTTEVAVKHRLSLPPMGLPGASPKR